MKTESIINKALANLNNQRVNKRNNKRINDQ